MEIPTQAGVERFRARCEDCPREWDATGTSNSRRAHQQARRHMGRTGHQVAAEWTNRRPEVRRMGVLGG